MTDAANAAVLLIWRESIGYFAVFN